MADEVLDKQKVDTNINENIESTANHDEAAAHKTHSGKPFKDVDHFVNEDKQYLFCRTWMPECEPKALFMMFHGYSLHSGYFAEIAEAAVGLGMLVFAHDDVGHGESEGDRCDVTSYEVYVRDALQHVKIMKEKYPHLPLYLFGHSKGGGLAIVLAGKHPDLFNGLVLCAPMVASDNLFSGAQLFFMKLKSLIVPGKEMFLFQPEVLTRNTKLVEKFKNDPLIYHGKMKLRMMVQLSRMYERVWELIPQVNIPVLVLQGDKDVVCDITGAEELMRCLKGEDKTIKIYKGAYHEPFHEIDDISQRFFDDVKEWFQKHLSK